MPITLIFANPNQPRKLFDEAKLEELAGSIKSYGVLEPIVVTPRGERFMIIAGERRFRASNIAGLEKMLLSQAEGVGREIRKLGFKARTVILKIKLSDFKIITRSRTLPEPFDTTDVLFNAGHKLLVDLKLTRKVRLIGIGVSNLSSGPCQMTIGSSGEETGRQGRLDRALDKIHSRFRGNMVLRGRMMDEV